ncbi:MAG: HAD-IB family hydrolase [Chloroflexi bacterium]|nr:HAD-IB family hydrolase [Chloroflexota bacterium]
MPIAFFDLDGTLFDGYTWLSLKRYYELHRFKLPTLYAFLSLHLPAWLLVRRIEPLRKQLYHAWGANMAWLMRGVPVEQAETIWDWLVENEILPKIRPEMKEATQWHRREGHGIVLLSGAFAPLVDRLAERLDVDAALATPLAQRNGHYTGRIVKPLNIGAAKVQRIKTYLAGLEGNTDLRAAYMYTDSVVDLPVLEIVGNPVAVYPDQKLMDAAIQRGWDVIGEVTEG